MGLGLENGFNFGDFGEGIVMFGGGFALVTPPPKLLADATAAANGLILEYD